MGNYFVDLTKVRVDGTLFSGSNNIVRVDGKLFVNLTLVRIDGKLFCRSNFSLGRWETILWI